MEGNGPVRLVAKDTAPAMTTRNIGENFNYTPVRNRLPGRLTGRAPQAPSSVSDCFTDASPTDISLISALLVAQRDHCVLATELAKALRPLDCLERGAAGARTVLSKIPCGRNRRRTAAVTGFSAPTCPPAGRHGGRCRVRLLRRGARAKVRGLIMSRYRLREVLLCAVSDSYAQRDRR